MKLTFQITGSLALGLWAILMFFPSASVSRWSLLELVLQGNGWAYPQALIMTAVLVGYGVLAFVLASRRD